MNPYASFVTSRGYSGNTGKSPLQNYLVSLQQSVNGTVLPASLGGSPIPPNSSNPSSFATAHRPVPIMDVPAKRKAITPSLLLLNKTLTGS